MHDKTYLKILEILKQKHITQKDLAKKTKMKASSVSRILSGKYAIRLETLEKISKALNISVEDLLNDAKNFSNVNINISSKGTVQQTNTTIKDLEEKIKFKDEQIEFLKEKIKFLENKKK